MADRTTHWFNDKSAQAGFTYHDGNKRIQRIWVTGSSTKPLTFKVFVNNIMAHTLTGVPANDDNATIPGQGITAIEKIDDSTGLSYWWYPDHYRIEVG